MSFRLMMYSLVRTPFCVLDDGLPGGIVGTLVALCCVHEVLWRVWK